MAENAEEITPLKSALFRSVYGRLAGAGFQLRLAADEFVRRSGECTYGYQLVCRDAKPGYYVQPHVGVRINIVEDVFHQTSGFRSEYWEGTSTMGTAAGVLSGGNPRDCEFLLESESEIAAVTEKIVQVFHDVALPYFERWGSLAAIDAELNDKPAERSPHRGLAWFRCSTAIIVAKLVGRPDYEQLAAFYTEVMTKDNKGFYLRRFQALLKSLESVAAGTGLVP